jgi:hypothetical protein
MNLRLLSVGMAGARDVPLEMNVCATNNNTRTIPGATIFVQFFHTLIIINHQLG